MLDFEKFVARHGEVAAQALIENIERFRGMRADAIIPLEQRWVDVMEPAYSQALAA